ncbi:hypothetical protein L9F63_013249, partial [Diploptera punctata]
VPVPNYTAVDLSFSYDYFRTAFDFSSMDQHTSFHLIEKVGPIMSKLADDQFNSPQLQEFIKSTSNTSFDLVIMEAVVMQSYYGLVHHVGSPPVIGIMSIGLIWNLADSIGTPSNPSYIPETFLHFSDHMTFYERLQNTIFWLYARYKAYTELFPLHDRVMRKHFGDELPSVYEAERNLSLLMVGTNWLFSYPAPVAPAVIPFHSLHVKTTPDQLPEDLKKFLDEATNGVIYFSFGSNVMGNEVPEEKIRVFIEVFSQLPQKVLWKWESDTLPGKSANVRTGKWLPQQDILAHPNVRLFITQCGLQSFQEAVYHGIPLNVILPFKQSVTNNGINQLNMGNNIMRYLLQCFQEESLLSSADIITQYKNYADKAKQMSILSRDEPKTSLERIIWWTEYVIRHKGAKHLRSAALDLNWCQYLLLDVVAFFLISTFALIFTVYHLCIIILSYFKNALKIKFKFE